MRQTPQREAILRVLGQSDKPLSVEEIWGRMAENRSGLPTIYRNLERFVLEGWVENIMGADQTMRFVRCRSRSHHHHLQCENCGRVVEVGGCGIESSALGLESQTGFKITRHQLLFFGLCPDCRGTSVIDKPQRPATI